MARYKYTQESGADFKVVDPDKADGQEDTNQVRQVVDDLGNLLVHSKRDDLYPKDGTTGGKLAIPESQLNISNIIFCSDYDHPDDAITAIGASNKTLLVTEAETCDTNFTVPANVMVRFEHGGKWTVNTGVTVIFNGQISAGLWQIFALVGTGIVTKLGQVEWIYPQWYGAIAGEFTTSYISATVDATNEIQNALDTKRPVKFIGAYKITAQITIKGNVDAKYAIIWVYSQPSIAINISSEEIAAPTTSLEKVDIYLPRVISATHTIGEGWVGEGTGVRVINVYNSLITTSHITGFSIGLDVTACNSKGNTYNEYHICGNLLNNKVNFKIAPLDNTGWTNENSFYGGNFSFYGETPEAGTRCILIGDSTKTQIVGDNIFYKPCVEGTIQEYSIEIQKGIRNYILFGRYEGTGGQKILIGADSSDNILFYGCLLDTATITDNGTNNHVYHVDLTKIKALNLTDGQITFPTTQVPSAGVNTLDDYKEDEWTPALTFGGASVGMTYTAQAGLYTKIGRQVTVTGTILLSNKGTSEGAAKVSGLPFASKNATGAYSAPSFELNKISFANIFQGRLLVNSFTIDLEEITEAGVKTMIDNTNFANDSYLIITATYFTD